jgi:protein-tyrosine phosphatase
MGNICRSPTAEGIMLELLNQKGLRNQYECDSAGTHGYHVGEPADARMQRHANNRGYNLPSRSRKVHAASDFPHFDWILAMDNRNYADLRSLDSSGEFHPKIVKMTDFCKTHSVDEVPDPYYGGDAGFELVIDLLEDACLHFLQHLQAQHR